MHSDVTIPSKAFEDFSNGEYQTSSESFLQRIEHNARNIEGDQFIFIDEHGEKAKESFRDFESRSIAIASWLSERFQPGDRVVLLFPPGIDFIAAFIACLRANLVAVPAYLPKRNRSVERFEAILDDCDPSLILTEKSVYNSVAEASSGNRIQLRIVPVSDIKNCPPANVPLPKIHSDSLAFLQYTSGSTGTPKGVMVSFKNLVSNCELIQHSFGLDRDSRNVSWLPLFHDMGLIGCAMVSLWVGCPLIFMSPQTFIREPIQWLYAISKYQGTYAGGPNFGYEYCLRNIREQDLKELDLRSWKTAFNGSEPIRESTLLKFSERFSPFGFDPKACFPCYGMAETTLMISGGPAAQGWKSGERQNSKDAVSSDETSVVSCGPIGRETTLKIVCPETLHNLDDTQIGEIWVSGSSVATGYWQNELATQETFNAMIEATNEGPFLRTGDLGYLHEGELYVTGRLKDLIILRGRNIYPQDVESIVEECIDFAEPNSVAAFGFERDCQECLGIVIEASRAMVREFSQNVELATSNAETIVRKVNEAVAESFEITPHTVLFVRPGSFPRTTSGKVQRKACAAGAINATLEIVYKFGARSSKQLAGNETIRDLGTSSELKNPVSQSRLESALLGAVSNYLDGQGTLPDGGLRAEQSLVALGLDSLSACDLAIEAEKVSGIQVDADTIYQQKNVRNLARFLELSGAKVISPADTLTSRSQTTVWSATAVAPLLSRAEQFSSMAIQTERFEAFRQSNSYFFQTEIESQGPSYVRVQGKSMLMLASYSYLGLIGHPKVNEAIVEATRNYSGGVHGARPLAGTLSLHVELERRLATFMRSEAAVVFSSGYLTNASVIAALVTSGDTVIGDELIHASLAEGCRNSQAKFETFRHNNLDDLERCLKNRTGRRVLVVIDSVYSMDGDIAPVPDIVTLCRRYEALLMVDEAHSLGVLGKTGHGVQEHFNLPADAIDIKMGTLSKAIPSGGGFVAGSRLVVEYLKHSARGFIFSGSPTPAQTAAALASLDILEAEPERVTQLALNAKRFYEGVVRLGFRVPPTQSPIVPILFDSEEETLDAVRFCRNEGLFVVPVFYPAVPMNSPRIRSTVLASHTDAEIDHALEVLSRLPARSKMLM